MIARSKPVAQVYRLFGALVVLLVLMGIGLGISRWRAARSDGSPYGGLTAVALQPPADGIAKPARLGAATTPPQGVVPPPAAAGPEVPPADAAATTTTQPLADPTRTGPRVISLGKSGPDVTQPAPAAAVSAAVAAARAAPPPAPLPAAAEAEPFKTPADTPAVVASVTKPDEAPPGAININTASVEELNRIPGAGRIGRTIVRHRPYGSVQDLVDHRVLRASEFARIKAKLTTN